MKKLYLVLMLLSMGMLQHAYTQTNFNNQLLVYFKSGVQRVPPNNTTATITSQNVLNVLTNYGIPTSNVVPSFPNFNEADTVNTEIGESSRQMNRAKVYTITITTVATKTALLNSLNTLSEVLYAESNGYVSNNLIPIDGRFGQQWGMRNTFIPGADIHAEQAWDIFTGNNNSIIAIIDNGVDINHNDINIKIVGGDNGFQIQTDGLGRQFSHGSHVAGIAAAVSNNGVNNGVAGVDWQARIHSKNIFDGNGDPDITRSIIDAVNFNSNVWTLTNSWGLIQGFDEFGVGIPGRYSITVRSAFAHAYRNNRVSCIAMGNHQTASGNRYANVVSFPAGFNSGVISVGATDIFDGGAGFSANGPHIDVAAPGVGIWSTNFNNNYIDLSGTSMATPHVAGLASLLKGFNTNLANDDIEQIIRITADDANINQLPGFDNQMGNGRINAQRALQFLQAPNTVQHLSVTGGTVFNTSGNMTRIFLGVPGLADAAYVVRRREVRANVTFPAMCNILGVWGRGVGTTGFREENGRNFGEGICEVVPGTLTNTGATLRTWIYEVWAVNGQYLGFYPKQANQVVFQYSILGVPIPSFSISGPTNFCIGTTNYSIDQLGANTINWILSNTPLTPNAGSIPLQSNGATVPVTANGNGRVTLTANINIACNNQNISIAKNIGIGLSDLNLRFPRAVRPNPPVYNNVNVATQYTVQTNPFPGATETWTVSTDDPSFNWTYNSTTGAIQFFFTQANRYATFSGISVNSCGSTSGAIYYYSVASGGGGGGTPLRVSTSPNPAQNQVTVAVDRNAMLLNGVTNEQWMRIKEIKIYDKLGALKKNLQFTAGVQNTIVNISDLISDVYSVQVSNGTHTIIKQIIIQR